MYSPFESVLMTANIPTYVMCKSCDNFTLCLTCFMSDKYHHHPAHGFALKNAGLVPIVGAEVLLRLNAGRGLKHRAHCDACKEVSPPSLTRTLTTSKYRC